jgi:hypothetical protein
MYHITGFTQFHIKTKEPAPIFDGLTLYIWYIGNMFAFDYRVRKAVPIYKQNPGLTVILTVMKARLGFRRIESAFTASGWWTPSLRFHSPVS